MARARERAARAALAEGQAAWEAQARWVSGFAVGYRVLNMHPRRLQLRCC